MRIALTGNPNSGKTSIFNLLTGAHQHVGNWGGVTVELKEGHAQIDGETVTLVDLPGTYSLSAFSMEERVARDYVVEQGPDVVVQVVDATNMERHLYLTVQLLELGIRPLIALNMWDEVLAKGLRIDTKKLAQLLQVPVVTTVGRTGEGVREMLAEAVRHGKNRQAPPRLPAQLPRELTSAVADLAARIPAATAGRHTPQWLALKLLESDSMVSQKLAAIDGLVDHAKALGANYERASGQDPESAIVEARYGYVAGAVKATLTKPGVDRIALSDRIDSVLTHPFLAYPVFLAFMWLLFQATFTLGQFPADLLDGFFGWLADALAGVLPNHWLSALLTEGMIRGVGGVLTFLPNILILFFGIAIMEDTGYMARAAFIMDRFMSAIGLHGKSFVPVIMGMGCTVPAIMAARTLESPRDRIKTILLTPLISCSARLPVYVLFAGALFPRHAGAVVFLFNFVFGLVAFFMMGWLFKKTLFKGEDTPFVMELPPYRIPTLRSVSIHMWQRAQHYLAKMGGVVLVCTALIWWLGNFPKSPELDAERSAAIAAVEQSTALSAGQKSDSLAALNVAFDSRFVRQSYIGRIGVALEPLVLPLGFNWQAAVSLVTGFVAKEVVVSSMGVLYAAGAESDEQSQSLREAVRAHFTPLTGIAFMLFVLLYTPCVVAFVTLARELRDWRWTTFSLAYQLGFAWFAAFAVYQTGRLLGLG